MCTQRTHPKLATIEAWIDPAVLAGERVPHEEDAMRMRVIAAHGRHANGTVLEVPLCSSSSSPSCANRGEREVYKVRVWGWDGRVVDEGDDAAAWITAALRGGDDNSTSGEEFRLSRFDASVTRVVESRFNSREDPAITELADGFPILVANEASASDVNSRTIGADVRMDRFRANVIVGGDSFGPWAEDAWDRIAVSSGSSIVTLSLVKPCARCTVPEVDQDTGEVLRSHVNDDDDVDENSMGAAPPPTTTVTAALKSLRRTGADLGFTDRKLVGGLFFGWNALVDRSQSSPSSGGALVVHVGDAVEPTIREPNRRLFS